MISKNRSVAPSQQSKLQMFVLDVLQHDVVEQVSSLVRLLNDASGTFGWREFWPCDFTTQEVVSALTVLLRDGSVAAMRESAEEDELQPIPTSQSNGIDFNDVWFALTDQGRRRLDEWNPPTN